jgi:two-component system response regulator AtoC
MRVLLVDDERRLAESLAEYLRAEGIEAIPAFDGMEGRRLLEESPYDALVTDLRMPGLDGLALLRWVREEGPSLPVVVISAHGEVRDAVAASSHSIRTNFR